MRSVVGSIVLAFALSGPALADLTLSTEIGTTGIAATAARLSALPSPTANEAFALAGLRFLSGVERALQLRWQTGVRADWSELPILRLPIPENPAARPFVAATSPRSSPTSAPTCSPPRRHRARAGRRGP